MASKLHKLGFELLIDELYDQFKIFKGWFLKLDFNKFMGEKCRVDFSHERVAVTFLSNHDNGFKFMSQTTKFITIFNREHDNYANRYRISFKGGDAWLDIWYEPALK